MRFIVFTFHVTLFLSTLSATFCFLVTPTTKASGATVWPTASIQSFISAPQPSLQRHGQNPSRWVSTALAATLQTDQQASAARYCIRQGMAAFRQGNVQESIVLFDQAELYDPRVAPYLWQRGLSLYYAERYKQASQQFQRDVAVNPADVEEIVWDIASLQQLENAIPGGTSKSFPPVSSLRLPTGIRDRRRIMSFVYQIFTGSGTEHQLAMAGTRGNGSAASAQDEFYSLLYLGLYCEIREEPYKAAAYMTRSLDTDYYKNASADYMTAVARVHCQLRGWK